MIRINKRRKSRQKLLFRGYDLGAAVTSPNAIATMVGDVFESITEHYLGAERGVTNSAADLCPDAFNMDGRTLILIECKSSQRRSSFKIVMPQLRTYWKALKEYAALREPCRILYAMWGYEAQHLYAESESKRQVIESVVGSIHSLRLVDLSIMWAVWEKRPKNCHYNVYDSWHGYGSKDELYRLLTIGRGFLDRLDADPTKVLREELGLDPRGYVVARDHVTRSQAVCSDEPFDCKAFDVVMVVRPDDYVEFPGLRGDADVPF